MVIFATIITLFIIGSLIGWIIEVLFRRFFSAKKWINPGFLVGPYIPLYGFGTIILYGLSNLDLSYIGVTNNILAIIIKILLIGICLTLIEFIAGLIFLKGLKIKLWDYSNQKGNIMGIICPLFSLFWLVIGCAYYFGINPFLVKGVEFLASESHHIYYLFIGIVLGMMIVDFAYSIHLASKIIEVSNKLKVTIDYDKFKENVKEKTIILKQKNEIRHEKIKNRIKKPFFFPFKDNTQTMSERIKDYIESDAYDYIQRQKDFQASQKRQIKEDKKRKD